MQEKFKRDVTLVYLWFTKTLRKEIGTPDLSQVSMTGEIVYYRVTESVWQHNWLEYSKDSLSHFLILHPSSVTLQITTFHNNNNKRIKNDETKIPLL
jgi:hypothetical protein